MLQVKHIHKEYRTGSLVQKALDDVSLNLRDNEFVAILGPSGSGKTTLLNIIGGLDQYDEGDLIINGISTKKYRDRDWDSYRNHTIGFVFQSYNLIPHQTLLSNVELALTISGISKGERTRRAQEALEQVGLGEQSGKRPNQLSGGQMQRVAIARALVNDPDILLADEPTGALDSATSVQVMDLLKEVAKDRLVVMVTHNPELAQQYATRIVTLKDGHILSDTDPFEVNGAALAPPSHKNMGKSSMSFLTALALSFNNLRTKKARTLLTSFAGSIGIIGIALILALSNGVNDYIQATEEQTLAEYPLQITSTGMDLTSLMASRSDMLGSDESEEGEEINVIQTVTGMFSSVDTNDLASLKEYLESGETDIEDYTTSIEYKYDVAPQIYRLIEDENSEEEETDSKSSKKDSEEEESEVTYRQVNPDQTLNSMGMSMSSSVYSSMMSTDTFYSLPSNEDMYLDQYEVKAGRWPENSNELVLVLTESGSISDFTLYSLGLRDAVELDEMISAFMNGEDAEVPEDMGTYSYDDILGITFKLVNAADYYEYDKEYEVWKDKKDNTKYMTSLIEDGEDLEIVGIVQPKEDATSEALTAGINYPYSLTAHVVEMAEDSEIVQDQLANRNINVFTGEKFGEESDSEFDMNSLFAIDEDALSDLFSFDSMDLSDLELDTSSLGDMDLDSVDFSSIDLSSLDLSSLDISDMDLSNIDLSGLDLSSIDLTNVDLTMPEIDLADLLSSVKITGTAEDLSSLASALISGFQEYGETHSEADYSDLGSNILEYLQSDTARSILIEDIEEIFAENTDITITTDDLSQLIVSLLEKYQSYAAGMGYDLSENPLAYLTEYLQTSDAQSFLQSWLDENLNISETLAVSDEQISNLVSDLSNGYLSYASDNGYADVSKMGEYFLDYMGTSDAQSIMTSALMNMVDTSALQTKIQSALSEYMTSAVTAFGTAITQTMQTQIVALVGQMTTAVVNELMTQIGTQLSSALSETMTTMMTQVMTQMMSSVSDSLSSALTDSLSDAFSIDADAFEDAFQFNMDAEDLTELMMSMNSSGTSTYESNLSSLGYADFDNPSEIDIYPVDFESKEVVVNILDDYNDQMKAQGLDEQVITYTDMVGTLMSSVTDIIDMISYVLIAFVGISLVVSSIMIGVITYISVLERQKEIGILRAIGASKGNVSQIFNAETFIIGLCAGLLGVGLATILTFPANAIIRAVSGVQNLKAVLPIGPAVILVLLSIGLTMLGGLLPARKASKSDPVTALRTD